MNIKFDQCASDSSVLWLLLSNISHPGDSPDSPGKRDIIMEIYDIMELSVYLEQFQTLDALHYNLQYFYYCSGHHVVLCYRNPPVPCVYIDLYPTSWCQILTSHTLHTQHALIHVFTLAHSVIYLCFVSRACVQLHSSAAVMGASVEEFNTAKEKLGTLKKDPGNEVKLKIYALFKQVTNDQ